ncbi:protein MTSS 1 isoform X2 [Syngnathus scovelli]|uniref:protein MTSS 1 isoform X2 n=1 Tax=Syngnathus scovelli TaxID=161590 RepID=UPI0021107D60|nr:protein MTSS 1 isoform X2 [Syngnathus scovelli]
MDAAIEKECSALGGLFQLIMNDMKASYPTWEDFASKGVKLQSQLRTTILVTGAFLDAFQKVADMAMGSRGATKEIGSALTRMCMRQRSIESKLKLFTTALSESLITPLELKMEEWKKAASQLDKDHAKEYKKARADIKKKSSDTVKLQRKVKKGKDGVRGQLDSALQDVNVRYAVLEETEKRAVCRALIEERARYCTFVTMLKPVLDHEINVLGEVTHLQPILDDLTSLTAEPNKLPPASEQVILDLKGSDFSYAYQTPPASPCNTLSRKSSVSSYHSGSVRHVPSLDSISCAVDGVHIQQRSCRNLPMGSAENGRSLSEGSAPSRSGARQVGRARCGYAGRRPPPGRRVSRRDVTTDAVGSTNQLASAGMSGENGLLAPPHSERARAMSTSGQLALTLGALTADAPRSSRDSLHCSSGYSTQTTTPSCSEDTIHTHAVKREPPLYVDYESISLHGDSDSISLHHLSHGSSGGGGTQSDFDKSSTIPRNSDLGLQYRKFAQSKRPASTVSLLAETELTGGSHTATIRRKPSTKPAYRRGTISGGVPIPICTPQVPAGATTRGSDENVFIATSGGGFGYNKLFASTQSLSALPLSSTSSSSSYSPYYQLVPGQMPIPVPPEGAVAKQQQHLQQLNHQAQMQQQQQQQHLQQLNHQVQMQQQQQHHHLQQLNHQAQMQQQQPHLQQQHLQQLNHQAQMPQFHYEQQFQKQNRPQINSQAQFQARVQFQNQQHKQKLFQQQKAQLPASHAQREDSIPGYLTQEQNPLLSSRDQDLDQDLDVPMQARGDMDMLKLIKGVKLKRTLTNDRSAPQLPPPINHN